MDFYIHYTALPQGKSLADVVGELNEVLEDGGAACGGLGRPRRTAGFGAGGREGEPQIRPDGGEGLSPAGSSFRDTRVELGGMEIGVYE